MSFFSTSNESRGVIQSRKRLYIATQELMWLQLECIRNPDAEEKLRDKISMAASKVELMKMGLKTSLKVADAIASAPKINALGLGR